MYTLVMGGMRWSPPGYRYRAATLAYPPSQVCSMVYMTLKLLYMSAQVIQMISP